MRRLALVVALVLPGLTAQAQPAAEGSREAIRIDLGPEGLQPIDRTEPAKELKRLEKGSAADRARVIARAADAAPKSDEALALLAYAAGRARVLALRGHDLVTLARGLGRRSSTKAARDALFAVLVTPPREGFDGQALHQRIAAMALAQVAEHSDPPPSLPNVTPDPNPPPTTLDKLLGLADEPRFADAIAQALLRHPPRGLPRETATAASLRIGARLGDLRWAPLLEGTLREATSDDLRLAAVDAARELGDARALPRVLGLLDHPNPALAAASFSAWLGFDPARAIPELEKRLAVGRAPLPLLALARYVRTPALQGAVAARLGAEVGARGAEAARILATLPNGAGVPTLQKLARSDVSVHLAIDSLEATPGPAASRALSALLGDERPTARHEASFALLARALGSGADASEARAALVAAARGSRPLSTVVRHWLLGVPTPRMQATADADERARNDELAQSTRAACARALRATSPACAFAFGAATPRTPSEAEQIDLQALLAVPDAALRGELLQGLLQSAWTGRFVALAQALEHSESAPLRRRLAAMAMAHPEALSALARSLDLVRSGEPDLVVARTLAGHGSALRPRPLLVRADPEGRIRCGYARDEANLVVPFVVEQGGAFLPAAHGDVLELVFTRCDDSVLKAATVR